MKQRQAVGQANSIVGNLFVFFVLNATKNESDKRATGEGGQTHTDTDSHDSSVCVPAKLSHDLKIFGGMCNENAAKILLNR